MRIGIDVGGRAIQCDFAKQAVSPIVGAGLSKQFLVLTREATRNDE